MSLIHLTAAELAEKIHAREVSAVEVARAHLERIAEVDGQVHAFLICERFIDGRLLKPVRNEERD